VHFILISEACSLIIVQTSWHIKAPPAGIARSPIVQVHAGWRQQAVATGATCPPVTLPHPAGDRSTRNTARVPWQHHVNQALQVASSKSHSSGDHYSRRRFTAVQFTTLQGSYSSSSIRSGIFTRSTSAHAKLQGHNRTREKCEHSSKTKILSSCEAGPCDSISYQLQKQSWKPRSS